MPSSARSTLLHRSTTLDESPDASFNSAAYTKGQLFGRTIEDLIGRSEMDAFLRDYFTRFAFHWVDERNFMAVLHEHLAGRPQIEAALRMEQWIYEPGLPSNVTAPTTSRLYDRIAAAARAFNSGSRLSTLATSDWTTLEEDLFLQLLDSGARLRMSELDAQFGFSTRRSRVWSAY